MMLRLVTCVEQRVLADLDLSGGVTESIFPEVERFLQSDHDHFKALQVVARHKDVDRYRSVVDFLFCETFTEWRAPCFRFYAGGGEPLRNMLSADERDRCAWKLMQMIQTAYEVHQAKVWASWEWLRESVLRAA